MAKADRMRDWQLQDAKARFSEVFRLAREQGPQRVTRHGREAVVIIPAEKYKQLTTAKQDRHGTLSEFFAKSPLRSARVRIERSRDLPRDIDL